MTAAPSPVPPVEPWLLQLGEIGVSPSWVVMPSGTAPLAGSQWWAAQRSAYTQHIPVWAIVLAVVLFPIGLLFLLAKETRVSTWVEVTVRSGGLTHVTTVPAHPAQVPYVFGQVEYVRGLASRPAEGHAWT